MLIGGTSRSKNPIWRRKSVNMQAVCCHLWLTPYLLFLAVLCAEILLLPVWAAAISIFGITVRSSTFDNPIEQLDLENMGIAVGILFVGVLYSR